MINIPRNQKIKGSQDFSHSLVFINHNQQNTEVNKPEHQTQQQKLQMPSIKREKDRLSSFSSVSSNSSPGKSEKKNLAILEISVRNRSATLGRNLFEAKGKDKEKRQLSNSMNIEESGSQSENSLEKLQRKSENQPKQEQIQSYFMRKIRVLQGKFKKYKLDNQTNIMKLRQENMEDKRELNGLKKFINKKYPKIYEEYINVQKNSIDNSNISSSNSSLQEIAMPINSQILQIKIQGKKLCDKIKELEHLLLLEKSINKKLEEQLQKIKSQKHIASRKWSTNTPQLTMDLLKDKSYKTFEDVDNPKAQKQSPKKEECSQCSTFRKHVLSLNASLRKIDTN